MKHKIKKTYGILVFLIGYILSPLSFYNDLIVNIPLAFALTFWVGYVWPGLMLPAFILGYWVTNLIGFIAMKYGSYLVLKKDQMTEKLMKVSLS